MVEMSILNLTLGFHLTFGLWHLKFINLFFVLSLFRVFVIKGFSATYKEKMNGF